MGGWVGGLAGGWVSGGWVSGRVTDWVSVCVSEGTAGNNCGPHEALFHCCFVLFSRNYLHQRPFSIHLQIANIILHEYIHMAINLEDAVWGLFSDPSALDSVRLPSPVFPAPVSRPYDMVFHATAVDVACLLTLGEAALGPAREMPQQPSDLDRHLQDLMRHSHTCLTSGGVDLLVGIVLAARPTSASGPSQLDGHLGTTEDGGLEELAQGGRLQEEATVEGRLVREPPVMPFLSEPVVGAFTPADVEPQAGAFTAAAGQQVGAFTTAGGDVTKADVEKQIGDVTKADVELQSGDVSTADDGLQSGDVTKADVELQSGAFANADVPWPLKPLYPRPDPCPQQQSWDSGIADRTQCLEAYLPQLSSIIGCVLNYGHRYIPQFGGKHRALFWGGWEDRIRTAHDDAISVEGADWRSRPPIESVPEPPKPFPLWTEDTHLQFPDSFQAAVWLLLLMERALAPPDLLYIVLQYMAPAKGSTGMGPYGKGLVTRLRKVGLRRSIALGVTPPEAAAAIGVRESALLTPSVAVKYRDNECAARGFYQDVYKRILHQLAVARAPLSAVRDRILAEPHDKRRAVALRALVDVLCGHPLLTQERLYCARVAAELRGAPAWEVLADKGAWNARNGPWIAYGARNSKLLEEVYQAVRRGPNPDAESGPVPDHRPRPAPAPHLDSNPYPDRNTGLAPEDAAPGSSGSECMQDRRGPVGLLSGAQDPTAGKALLLAEGRVSFETEFGLYTVDVHRMEQINSKTGKVRPVRRVFPVRHYPSVPCMRTREREARRVGEDQEGKGKGPGPGKGEVKRRGKGTRSAVSSVQCAGAASSGQQAATGTRDTQQQGITTRQPGGGYRQQSGRSRQPSTPHPTRPRPASDPGARYQSAPN